MALYDNQMLEQYLLGKLDAAHGEDLREQMLRSPELFDRLREVEDELLDRYARGEFSRVERENLERFIVETGQASRLAMARALAAQPAIKKSGTFPLAAWTAIAASLVVAAMFGYLWLEARRVRPVAGLSPPLAWRLDGETLRSAQEVAKFQVSTGIVELRVAAEFAVGNREWIAEVRNAAGGLVHGQMGNVASGVKLLMRGDGLEPGLYAVEVRSGDALVAASRFEIVR